MQNLLLVVEDDEIQRRGLHDGLTIEGFEVLSASDGAQGLEIALKSHPDAILTDIKMPKMDGMTMIHKLREDEWGKKVPIIILTNFENTDTQLDQILIDYPAYYLIKVENTLAKIVEKIRSVLKG